MTDERLYKQYDAVKHTLWRVFALTEKFQIPIYQRDFSWQDEQVEEFLESIANVQKEEFYLGAIVLADKNIIEQREEIEDDIDDDVHSLFVVDGQQRLTTLLLIIHCMLERIAKDVHPNNNVKYFEEKRMTEVGVKNLTKRCNNAYVGGLLTNVNREVIPAILLKDEKLKLHNRIKLTNSLHTEIWPLIFNGDNIEERKKQFNERQKAKTLTAGDQLLWEQFLKIRETVNTYHIDEFVNIAYKFFTGGDYCPVHCVVIRATWLEVGANIFYGMNTKGLQLAVSDLIKARLVMVAGSNFKGKKEKYDAQKEYVNVWRAFENDFAKKMNSSDENKLRDYLLDWIVSRHHEDDYITEPSKKRISKTTMLAAYHKDLRTMQQKDEYLGIDNVLTYLKNTVDIYRVLANIKTKDKNNKNRFAEFDKDICPKGSAKVKQLNIAMSRMQRLIELKQHRRIFIYIFEELSDDPKADKLIYTKNIEWLIKITNLVTSFLLRTRILSIQSQSFRPWINDVLEKVRSVIKSENDKNKHGEKIYNTIKKYFDEIVKDDDRNMSDAQVKSEMSRHSFKSNKDQKFLKSLLWEIEFEYTAKQGLPDTIDEMLKQWGSYHIEHIYPKSNTDQWVQYYKLDPKDVKSVDAHEALFESRFDAGNTTLWHEDPNISEGTNPFSKKIKEFEKNDRLIHQIIDDCKESNNDDGWTKKSINDMSKRYGELVIDLLNKLSNS